MKEKNMQEKKVIGIIPCKKVSSRLPGKNTMFLGGKMLFEWSVEYAKNEGITPVVSTDDEYVIGWCNDHGIRCVREKVDDSNMCNCVDQVLNVYGCDYFVLLQPTSPIRERGLLSSIISDGVPTSVYTSNKIKVIGHLDGKFQEAFRDQDGNTRFLHQHDGNMVVVNTEWYNRTHKLFNDESIFIDSRKPYNLQIDTKDDFETIRKIVS